MEAGEVLGRVLRDHERLRGRLEEIARLSASRPGSPREHARVLRARGLDLLAALERHMRWEDRHLVPALREADAFGAVRAARVESEHRTQRAILARDLETLRDRSPALEPLVERLRAISEMLRADMEEEERFLCEARALGARPRSSGAGA